MFRASQTDYFNPDEAARALMVANPGLSQRQANAMAWLQGKTLLERAVSERLSFAFETTLGGNTMVGLLEQASMSGIEVRVWYVGLTSPELHIGRVRARVAKGGHPIPDADVYRRYESGRANLIRLLPRLTELRVFDNSAEADPSKGEQPQPKLVLHTQGGQILAPNDFSGTPVWAKPIVAAALSMK